MNDSAQRDSLEAAYGEFADEIFRFCAFRMRDRDAARDAVQEAFCRTWEYMCEGGEVGHIRAFLYRTVRNIMIDHHRRKKALSLDALAESEQGFDPPSHDHENMYVSSESARVLLQIDALGSDLKEVFLLRFVNDLPLSEIAEILGIAPNLVSVRIHRALAIMKTVLKISSAKEE